MVMPTKYEFRCPYYGECGVAGWMVRTMLLDHLVLAHHIKRTAAIILYQKLLNAKACREIESVDRDVTAERGADPGRS